MREGRRKAKTLACSYGGTSEEQQTFTLREKPLHIDLVCDLTKRVT